MTNIIRSYEYKNYIICKKEIFVDGKFVLNGKYKTSGSYKVRYQIEGINTEFDLLRDAKSYIDDKNIKL